jgi:hypothetical protein
MSDASKYSAGVRSSKVAEPRYGEEGSRDERENCESRSKKTAVVLVKAVPVDFDSALSQLNMLDAPDGVSGPIVDVSNEASVERGPDFDNERAEAPSVSSVPTSTTHCESALAQLKSSDTVDRIVQQDSYGTYHYFHRERMSSESAVEKPEIVVEASSPREFADNESALSLLNELCAPSEAAMSPFDDASEGARHRQPSLHSRGESAETALVGEQSAGYYSALLQIIDSAENDPRKLRRLVYELARTNLREHLGQGGFAPRPDEIRSLEIAIARVEVDLLRGELGLIRFGNSSEELNDEVPKFLDVRSRAAASRAAPATVVRRRPAWPSNQQTFPREGTVSRGVGLSAPPEVRAPVEIVYPERDKSDAVHARRRVWLWFVVWPLIQLTGLAGFCLALYFALAGRLDVRETQTRQAIAADAQPSLPFEAARGSGLPLPSTYGVYAISNGQLSELQPLPIRAPDPRVQLSAEISVPSSSVLADGKVVFILFRRELLNDAPQKVAIRVVARVASALTFSSGKAAAAKPDASWHIRGNSYEFLVSPLNENREMVVVRPMDKDFALRSGRYALVFGGLAYDFTVAGPVTDPAQCLESFEAVNGWGFTECRPK